MRLHRQIVLAGLIAVSLCSAAQATTTARATSFEKWSKSAQRAFDRGLYKQSERLWARALAAAAESNTTDSDLALVLKRLGETLLKEGRYEDAQRCFRHAVLIDEEMAVEDSELAGDQAMLAATYKRVDLAQLGKFAQDLLAKADLTSMGIVKTDSGSRVLLEFPEPFNKIIDNKDVEAVGVDRSVSFDIEKEADGTVRISHIKGFRVHAKYWVNIVDSKFRLGEDGTHEAEVTAEKMGISKTVHAKLKDDEYAPLGGLLSQMSWANDVATLEGSSVSKESASTSAPADAAVPALGAGSSTGTASVSGAVGAEAGATATPTSATAIIAPAATGNTAAPTLAAPALRPMIQTQQPGVGTSTPGIESNSNPKNEIGQPRSIP